MKKALSMLLALLLTVSVTMLSVSAQENSGKGRGKEQATKGTESGQTHKEKKREGKQEENKQEKKKLQKVFKQELTEKKDAIEAEKDAVEQQKEELSAQYDALLASGDTAAAEALQLQISQLHEQLVALRAEMKKTINERFMVTKTLYSAEELAQFESASELIAQMYEDARVMEAGSVMVNRNLIKFDAPAYIKGGVTLVPIRAVSESLGAEVTWDNEKRTVTITKGDTVIELHQGSTTALVNGEPVTISTPSEVTCGRTYLPLRFLAELLDFQVAWDGENEVIDIEDGDTTTEDGTTEEDAATDDSTTEEDATTDDSTTEEDTATDDSTTTDSTTDDSTTTDSTTTASTGEN